MVSDFEAKHNVKEVGLLVREELMSSEDESFGNIEEGIWMSRAARYTAKGQKALEIHRLECRSDEVSTFSTMIVVHKLTLTAGQRSLLCFGPTGIL